MNSRALLFATLPSLLLAPGCKMVRPPAASVEAQVTPAEAAEAASETLGPFALRGSFSLSGQMGEQGIPALAGGFLYAPTDKMRTEIRGPVGGALFMSVTDGDGLGLYLASESIWLFSDDADEDLAAASGGVLDLEDLLQLSLGRMPQVDLEPVAEGNDERGPWYDYAGDSPGSARLYFSPDDAAVAGVELRDGGGVLRMSAFHEEFMEVEGVSLPKLSRVVVPDSELTLEFSYSDWTRLGRIPNAFGVTPPAGAEQIRIGDAIQLLRDGATPPGLPVAPE